MSSSLPKPAIVVAAWNRPRSLQRLLEGLARGDCPASTTLHISIDHFEYDHVLRLAEGFAWPHGEKVVEMHPERLGLRQHMLYCGGLAERYGSIVLLEDDLGVAPHMYAYAQAALGYYAVDPTIAGISLYSYAVAESCLQPFQPWIDEWDTWFLQVPSSWGVAFTAAQWTAFQGWWVEHPPSLPPLPRYMEQWGRQSWKKLFAAYLIHERRYVVYPRFSLTTNFEDHGAHATTRGLFQVPLSMGRRAWNFGSIQDSMAVYDAHFEPLTENLRRICPALLDYDFAVDTLGQKDVRFLDRAWVLTCQRGGEARLEFGREALPVEMNLLHQVAGRGLRLVPSQVPLQPVPREEVEFTAYAGAAKAPVLHLPEHRLPSISVVVAGADAAMSAGVASLLSQDYPGLEISAVVEQRKCPPETYQRYCEGHVRLVEHEGEVFEGIRLAVARASGQLVWIIAGQVQPMGGVLWEVAKLFRQYPGLEWMSGLPRVEASPESLSREIARYRWDTARFADAGPADLQVYLPAAFQVFRHVLWMRAGEEATSLPEQFRRMAAHQLPTVATLQLVGGHAPPLGVPSVWGDGNVNQTRVFYHRHIPLLWRWHRHLSDYKPVLRYDAAHGTWYAFDY